MIPSSSIRDTTPSSQSWTAPFGTSKQQREAFRLALCTADIAAVKAIRAVDRDARMVHIDPLILVVPPKDRPDLADEAEQETKEDTFYAWDVISGLRHPELSGSPEVLDIVGVNCYSFGQMEFREKGPHASLGRAVPRRTHPRPVGYSVVARGVRSPGWSSVAA